jgi:gamma-glutamylcyclotransferase (GGCT)/AIG2-like uncharacterized protein YtfP
MRGVALMVTMTDRVFFYGTLMSGFDRRRRAGIDPLLTRVGRGRITAALFDLGIYPAAVPDPEGTVWGEVYRTDALEQVLGALDDIEGYRADLPEASLYLRVEVPVTDENGESRPAWTYFYNAPLGRAERIRSGDYLEHLGVR